MIFFLLIFFPFDLNWLKNVQKRDPRIVVWNDSFAASFGEAVAASKSNDSN